MNWLIDDLAQEAHRKKELYKNKFESLDSSIVSEVSSANVNKEALPTSLENHREKGSQN